MPNDEPSSLTEWYIGEAVREMLSQSSISSASLVARLYAMADREKDPVQKAAIYQALAEVRQLVSAFSGKPVSEGFLH